ncbi:MAG: tRNA ((6))-methyltransferase TrmN6 [Chthoniobacteraceae bacterium]|nr:tRNA ((6))-methyltransferase TrmN6 [Chthoniobacteraceae bacterium]
MSFLHENFTARKAALETEVGFPVSISGLTGPLRIFQRIKGHRHSIDDATTAWYALQKAPSAPACLDLGSGVGTVGLIVLWGLGENASLTCVEAQEVSYGLLRANVACNNLDSRVEAIHGDIRELHLPRKFPLITGSPPYFPIEGGTLPSDTQKAHARFELRGHVGNYAEAAKRHLTPDGLFVFCFPFQQKARCIELVHATGFRIVTIRDVFPRRDRPALFSLYSARLDWAGPIEEEPAFIVSEPDGAYTPEMIAMQRSRNFGPDGTNEI